MSSLFYLLAIFAPVVIPANTPFRVSWGPLPDTVNYRVIVDSEQIGADFPRSFPTDIGLVYGPASSGVHYLEVYSINSNGVLTSLSITINGTPTPSFQAPYNIKRAIYVEAPKTDNPILP